MVEQEAGRLALRSVLGTFGAALGGLGLLLRDDRGTGPLAGALGGRVRLDRQER